MNVFKRQCVQLRQKDHTLNEIMKITGRSKSSVYTHIHRIPLSPQKQAQISENSRQLALRVAAARKGKALRPYKPFQKWNADMVLLVAHLTFDGEITRKRCVYNNRSKVLVDRVVILLKKLYDFSPTYRKHPVSGVIRVEYSNVELEEFLYTKSYELQKNVINMPKRCQKEFLRAFFDDEGCMDVRLDRNTRRIRGYQKDKNILKIIQSLLRNFDIEAKIREPNEVVISGKENLKKFQKEINFSKGVRLNPKRTNSLWKKNIEKRNLLDMAIRSFRT